MGYFSTRAELDNYAARWCSRCVHQYACPVWEMHLWRDSEEASRHGSLLHKLIPLVGTHNCRCQMFHLKERGE